MMLHISEKKKESVAVKNIIPKIMVLLRKENSLSTREEKKDSKYFHFILRPVQYLYNLLIILQTMLRFFFGYFK